MTRRNDRGDRALEIGSTLDGLTVDFLNYVTAPRAGFGGGAGGTNPDHDRPLSVGGKAEVFRRLGVQILD